MEAEPLARSDATVGASPAFHSTDVALTRPQAPDLGARELATANALTNAELLPCLAAIDAGPGRAGR
jgi:hypothetical protein